MTSTLAAIPIDSPNRRLATKNPMSSTPLPSASTISCGAAAQRKTPFISKYSIVTMLMPKSIDRLIFFSGLRISPPMNEVAMFPW